MSISRNALKIFATVLTIFELLFYFVITFLGFWLIDLENHLDSDGPIIWFGIALALVISVILEIIVLCMPDPPLWLKRVALILRSLKALVVIFILGIFICYSLTLEISVWVRNFEGMFKHYVDKDAQDDIKESEAEKIVLILRCLAGITTLFFFIKTILFFYLVCNKKIFCCKYCNQEPDEDSSELEHLNGTNHVDGNENGIPKCNVCHVPCQKCNPHLYPNLNQQ